MIGSLWASLVSFPHTLWRLAHFKPPNCCINHLGAASFWEMELEKPRWSPTFWRFFLPGNGKSCHVDGATSAFNPLQCIDLPHRYMCRISEPQPSPGLLESHPEVPRRAGVPLRLRSIPLCLHFCHQWGPKEVSQPLHILSDSAQPNPKRPGSGGLRLRHGPSLQEQQTSHRAVPAADQHHGLYWGPTAVWDGPALQLSYEGLFIPLQKTFRRGMVLGRVSCGYSQHALHTESATARNLCVRWHRQEHMRVH